MPVDILRAIRSTDLSAFAVRRLFYAVRIAPLTRNSVIGSARALVEKCGGDRHAAFVAKGLLHLCDRHVLRFGNQSHEDAAMGSIFESRAWSCRPGYRK
jgi:hypothetical protein